ncbi:hypothetical protein ACOSQ3_029128 [Xanthoceras sorbifolium]
MAVRPLVSIQSLESDMDINTDNPTLSPRRLATRPPPSRGVPKAQFLVSLVSPVAVPTVPARESSVTYVVVSACSRPPRSGGAGIGRST